MIDVKNLSKSFGDHLVLDDISEHIYPGDKVVIIGPSGSGKSTTVRCMNFLETPTSGHVYIDGEELTAKNKTKLVRRTTSMVFQQFNLYPHMTVLHNLTLAPIKLHHKSRKRFRRVCAVRLRVPHLFRHQFHPVLHRSQDAEA